MLRKGLYLIGFSLWLVVFGQVCLGQNKRPADFWTQPLASLPQKPGYVPGSFRFELYLKALRKKRVGLVVNHTSRYQGVHLVDTLRAAGIQIVRIFSPEHGFRGTAANGEKVASGTDAQTGIPIVSLYGKNKRPEPAQLQDLDVLLFDLQDVGARFYTYISTMKEVMEACASQGLRLYIGDRFNPLGFCSAGPILQPGFESFVGAFPIPVVHGLTVGELAQMAVDQGWIKGGKKLKLKVLPCLGYNHSDTLFPAVPPSPNLPTPLSVWAYPSLCLFEGTPWSVGRGTPLPFQVFGFPDSACGPFSFRPGRTDSNQVKPLFHGQTCFGFKLGPDSIRSCFSLHFLHLAYARHPQKAGFFNPFFRKLAGSDEVSKSVEAGREWAGDLSAWNKLRRRYLRYPE